MVKGLIFILVISSSIVVQTAGNDCGELRHHALQKCRHRIGKSLEQCMHKRMKRSQCKSENQCGECNCDYCTKYTCSSRCDSCCNPVVYEEEEVCQTAYCCHKMCHKKCYTPGCRRPCRDSCVDSIRAKKPVIERNSGGQQGTNITTVINLHNKINNTNLIDMPIKINTTNINNLNLTAPVGIEMGEVGEVGEVPGTTQPQDEETCCELLVELCDPYDRMRCYREKQRYCGRECSRYHPRPPKIPPKTLPPQPVQVPLQQYYPFQQQYLPAIPQQLPQAPSAQMVPKKIVPSRPTTSPQYPAQYVPQIYPSYPNYPNYPAYVPPKSESPPQYLPQGCKPTSGYPFVLCPGSYYPNQQWQGPPIQPNLQKPQNSQSNLPYQPSDYQTPQHYYDMGQDLPGQPRAAPVEIGSSSYPNNDYDADPDHNAIDDDEDDEEKDEE